jgi:hypothetical protein
MVPVSVPVPASIFVVVSVSFSISVSASVSCPVPVLPLRFLPTEDCPPIVLHSDQRLYRADARIDNMVPAPVLHDAIWTIVLVISVFLSVLGVGSQAKKAKQAKRA